MEVCSDDFVVTALDDVTFAVYGRLTGRAAIVSVEDLAVL